MGAGFFGVQTKAPPPPPQTKVHPDKSPPNMRQKPTQYATKATPKKKINITFHICQGYVFI